MEKKLASSIRYAIALAFFCMPQALQAETELSVYTGFQGAFSSDVSGDDGAGGDFDFSADWDGKPIAMPPYYGLRGTYWVNDNWGFGAEFTHTKVYASDETLADSGFETLEFSDGLNILTANAMRRFPNDTRVTPYLGFGLGVAIPHVEATPPGGAETFEYQMTGVAARAVAGASYKLNDRWAVFGEYNGTYSANEADLVGGGTLKTNILTNAVNIGTSFSF